jgi:hypothetical protein
MRQGVNQLFGGEVASRVVRREGSERRWRPRASRHSPFCCRVRHFSFGAGSDQLEVPWILQTDDRVVREKERLALRTATAGRVT